MTANNYKTIVEESKKSNIEMADIFREYKAELPKLKLSIDQWKVVQDILNCRTAALGGHTQECDECGHSEQQYNSCRNRHCPKCQFSAKIKWLEANEPKQDVANKPAPVGEAKLPTKPNSITHKSTK